MRRIADRAHRDSIDFCLLDKRLHHLITRDHAHAVVRVRDERGRRLLEDLILCRRLEDPGVDSIEINRLKTVHAVALNASAVTLHKYICADLRIFLRKSGCLECVDHEVPDELP